MNTPLLAPLLDIQGLSLEVAGRSLIKNLSFCVRPGEIWGLLGPNGAGKTTLLHTVAGLREAQGGTVSLDGRGLADWKPMDAARLRGFLPQIFHDTFSASVLDCVMMGRHPHLGRWQWEGESEREMAVELISLVDLAGFENRDVLTLSGGERQRVALAAIFAQDPSLLLLDEPLSHLDLRHQVLVLSHLEKLARLQGKGVLFSIHDLNLAARFSSHAVILGSQGVISLGPSGEVMTEDTLSRAFGHRVTRVAHAGRTLFVAE